MQCFKKLKKYSRLMKCENGPTQPNLSKYDSKRFMQETTLYSESKHKLIITNEKIKTNTLQFS